MNKHITIGSVPFTPEEAGYESLYIDRLNGFIARMLDEKIVQGGSYHLFRRGKLFANNAVGSLDYREPDKPLLPDSIRRIASITKLFTSVAIFQLAEQGYININDPVAQHLSEFDTSLHRGITVYNLLTHTSGLLPDGGAFDEPYENRWTNHINNFDGNWIKAMLTQPPHCKPNTEWAYSSYCFCMLGEIIQRISGKKLEDFVMENIVTPLHMKDTFYELPEELFDRVCVTTEWEIPRKRSNKEENIWDKVPPGGWGICSTPADLSLFGQMLLNNGSLNGTRIIGRKSVENLVHPHLKNSNFRNYCWGADEIQNHHCGLGFEVMADKPFNQMSEGTYGHEGSGVSWFYVDPKEEFIASVFMPYYEGNFNLIPIHRTKYVIWAGLI
ncbi:MAG: beta-lactamase family protein [Oscillospiraceae bacterium]|jgi:CubicO group peptidase (beta-lactamase class C family)|nr:beta-lactamase family protein [Oscillospiraceae bacterium]